LNDDLTKSTNETYKDTGIKPDLNLLLAFVRPNNITELSNPNFLTIFKSKKPAKFLLGQLMKFFDFGTTS